MTRKEALKRVLVFLLVITSVSAILLYVQNSIGITTIQDVVAEAGIWGPALFILIILLTHVFAPIQGSPFVIVGFAVFGKWAVVHIYLATAISSLINFWIARKFGRNLVTRFVGKAAMAKVDHIATHEGVKVLIIMRLFQGFVTDFISYAAGFTSIRFPAYYLVSLLAPLPWTILMFIFFDSIPQQQVFGWMLVIGAVFFVIPPTYYFLKHRLAGKRLEHT